MFMPTPASNTFFYKYTAPMLYDVKINPRLFKHKALKRAKLKVVRKRNMKFSGSKTKTIHIKHLVTKDKCLQTS